jgi:hypothetical protein
LKYEDVVSSYLSEEMRWKIMDSHNTDSLSVRCRPQDRNKIKSSGGRYKSKGISKSSRKYLRKCWKCGKAENYKKYWSSKNVDKENGSDDASSIEVKTSIE